MSRTNTLPGLLVAVLAMPFVAGCAVLGLPPADETIDTLPAAGIDGDLPTPEAEASPTFFSSSDGYALTLPVGWIGARTNGNASDATLDLLTETDVTLADEARALMDETGARLSMIGAETDAVGVDPVPPAIAILMLSTDGASDSETQQRLGDVIGGIKVADGEIQHSVISVAAGDAHRYDMTVTGEVLSVQLRVYLFTVGDDGVVILFGSDPSQAEDVGPVMDTIVKSLRFGV